MTASPFKESACVGIGNPKKLGGPDKWEFATAFFDGKDINLKICTRESPDKLIERKILLHKLEWGEPPDEGHAWWFWGVLSDEGEGFIDCGYSVQGYYSTGSRRGWMEIIPD